MKCCWSIALLLVLLGQTFCRADSPENGVRCIESEDAIDVTVAGLPLLRYNKATLESPEGIDPMYRRSGHIHPLYTPDGRVITGDFPVDHPHQHALFHAWRQVKYQGRKLSFWEQRTETARVSHDKVLAVENGPERGRFVVEHRLDDLTASDKPLPVLTETWTVDIYNRGREQFVFDIQIDHRCAGSSPVLVSKYHYGGMAFRGTSDWFRPDAMTAYKAWQKQLETAPETPPPSMEVMGHEFLTNEGLGQFRGNHSQPQWVDLYGPLEGQLAGIAIFGHPRNFRSPQHVRLHPSKPYFCYSPMVESSFEITPEKPFSSRYRFLIHNGAPQPKLLNVEAKRFAASK